MNRAASSRPRIVALISGRGSNLKALLDARGSCAGEYAGVISNRPQAAGLDYARAAGIPVGVVDHCAYPDRSAFEHELHSRIEVFKPELVVLAGFMRRLSADFVEEYAGRMLNIHPSLLPAFPGLDTHRRALEAGVARHGASVHFVTAGVDEGPVILQGSVALRAQDTPETLALRVLLEVEHRIYPLAVRWFCAGSLALREKRIIFNGSPLSAPLQIEALSDQEVQA